MVRKKCFSIIREWLDSAPDSEFKDAVQSLMEFASHDARHAGQLQHTLDALKAKLEQLNQ